MCFILLLSLQIEIKNREPIWKFLSSLMDLVFDRDFLNCFIALEVLFCWVLMSSQVRVNPGFSLHCLFLSRFMTLVFGCYSFCACVGEV